jgi:hypothetical protein
LAFLTVFLLPATTLAQDDDVDATDNASPGSTLVIESFKCDWRHYEDINAGMKSINLPVYQAMVNEGLIISWGMYWHDWADEWNFHIYTVAEDKPSFFEAFAEATRRIGEIVGDDQSLTEEADWVLGDYCTEHKDGIYTLGAQTKGGADE